MYSWSAGGAGSASSTAAASCALAWSGVDGRIVRARPRMRSVMIDNNRGEESAFMEETLEDGTTTRFMK
jgi:hypothetical protein